MVTIANDIEISLCPADEIPLGMGRAFDLRGRSVAVFRTRHGKVYAVENTCPHRGGPLADGMLAGDRVVCPLHAFRFELHSGECDQPGTCAIQSFPAHIRNGWVVIAVPAISPLPMQGISA